MKLEINLNEEEMLALQVKLAKFFSQKEETIDLKREVSLQLKTLLLLWIDDSILLTTETKSSIVLLFSMTQTIKALRKEIEDLKDDWCDSWLL